MRRQRCGMLLQLWLQIMLSSSAVTDASYASSKPPTLELPQPLATEELSDWDWLEDSVAISGRNGRSHRPTLMDVALQVSVRQGLDAMAEVYGKIQPDMVRNGQLLEDNHPAALLSRFNEPHFDTERREMAAYATIAATKAFRKNFQHIDELARQSHAQKISLRRTALESLCPPRDPPSCMPASERYRTHDGTCNNKRRPRWGSAQMPFNRFLPPEYGDGVDSVRSSTDGSPLSSSRFVSLLVHGAREGEAPLTLMIAMWGQMLDHDLTSTAQPRSINGSIPSCCGGKDFHPSCFPIKVPLDDPWLAPLKVRCLEFLRSAPAQRRDCVLSWREQTNQVTSYIDASPIYSNSAKSADNARVFRNGLLIYGRGKPEEDVCQRGAIATQCIRAGDGRSGEQPGLLAMHHVWVGEHNRIAMELSELNPHWSDEKIYQEARRIVGAMFQHITYREFLPIILGREVCKLFDLDLLPNGYYEGYDAKVNPTVANSFAAAAFRFGHSLVQNSYLRCDRHHNIINNNVSLHEEFQRGDIGSAGSLHRLLRGLASQRALKRDEFITPELTNHLFQTPGFPFGLDLAAINVQRGRDHGIAPYTAWRVPCGLSPIHSFEDLANVVGPESAKRISHAYRSVHDIDLFVGGIAERPVVGGLVGPTFACIIAQQFSNSRRGDRFWYENGGFESSFTPAQLHSLRRVSLAQVLCRAVGGGTFQPHIFIPPEFDDNERVTCGAGVLMPIDLSPWLEQDPFAPQTPFVTPEIASNGLGVVHVIKEDKAGFSNRIKPTNSAHNPHIAFTPNSAIGFQRPNSTTKINDKLDLKRKTQTTTGTKNRHTTPTRKTGVNNKLDKSPKKPTNIRQPPGTTTRRTVVINNVAIQLRSAISSNTKENLTDFGQTVGLTRKSDSTDEPELRNDASELPNEDVELRLSPHFRNEEVELHSDLTTLSSEGSSAANSTISDIFKSTADELRNHEFNTTELRPNDPNNDDPKANKPNNNDPEGIDHKTNDPSNHDLKENPPKKNDPKDYNLNTNDPKENEPNTNDSKAESPQTNDPNTIQTEVTELEEKRQETNNFVTTQTNIKILRTKLQPTIGNSTDDTDQDIIDPLKEPTPDDHPPRVQRTARNSGQLINDKDATPFATNKKPDVKLLHSNRNRTSLPASFPPPSATTKQTRPTRTTKAPKVSKTTKRGVELRSQFQSRPIYTRPQKVIVNGPNADQYEIEINIRQTNKNPSPHPLTSEYNDYTTVYKPFSTYGSSYEPHYLEYATTTPAYAYYQSPPTMLPSPVQPYKTKPPTIIYLNEQDDRRTTTRQPNIFQNFLTFATNSFNGNRRPTSPPPPPSAAAPHQERPHFESFVVNSPNSGTSTSHILSATSYGSRPSSLHTQGQSPFPVSTSSQVGVHPESGFVHASSSAVSAGNFGSISGVASANGADSIFSFNIRPRPDTSPVISSVSSYVRPQNGGQYGLASQHRPDYPHSDLYYDRELGQANNLSPFSNSGSKPQHTVPYYARAPELKEASSPNEMSSVPDHKLDIRDYDYLSRTLANLTTAEGTANDDYMYDEDDSLNTKIISDGLTKQSTDTLQSTKKYETELKLASIIEVPNNTTNVTQLDDNYVLPMLTTALQTSRTTTNSKVTVFPDSLGKQLDNDILSDDYEEHSTDMKESSAKRPGQPTSIAFAPITLLTKPDRPDNWVIYNKASEEPPLPQPPVVSMDSPPTAEVPMPIQNLHNLWLKKDFKAMPETKTHYTTNIAKSSETTQTVTAPNGLTTESTTNAK
ncbi:uncharacterized protein LOC115625455 [Scaptodrosophila lebanonensis]|uniref:Uncharacterized protein LOC115625455 n=1 Tax=Drosophila lebanonensis TaxID=7225 RepID=A0A6J2TMJ9_DROLE|nr:uncharacterized protein LOC115625455 [Scaptodrosophila lebanonensis]